MIPDLFAQGTQSAQSGGLFQAFLPMILIFGVFYFLLIRPQQKRAKKQQEFLNNLKKGDQVITSGGLFGKIVGVSEKLITIEIADKIKVKVGKNYIQSFATDTQEPATTN